MSAEQPWELPLLLGGAFRAIVDDLHVRLAATGHPLARPLHGFALQALGPDGATASELGRRLGVSKQAAAKTITNLESLGYAERASHPEDQRAILIRRSAYGEDMLAQSARVFGEIRAELEAELGSARLAAFEATLVEIDQDRNPRLGDLPGWLR